MGKTTRFDGGFATAVRTGASGAAVERYTGVATAVFPNEPECGVYNNAILERDLEAAARSAGILRPRR